MLDAFFRSSNTWLARALSGLGPARGSVYAASHTKRALDLVLAIPLAAIAIGLILLLIIVNRMLSPRRPALFRQDRVGRGGGTLRVLKVRSMISRPGPDAAPAVCTAFGRFIRRYYLDELPQLLQVLTGRLSLVGIRILPRNVYDGLAASWSEARFEAWSAMYAVAPLGLSGTHQVFRRTGKEDSRRFHRDMFYARHATLGFDLYLLWRTLGSRDKEFPHVTTTKQRELRRAA
jgi:lipopolysaccharide/colanic/teichoic acid biosynthesis glycosyltransferase